MNRLLGMLKEEPKLLYYYEYIKQDEERVVKDGWKGMKDEIVDRYRIGETFSSEETDKNPEFYKFVWTLRQSFIGDMQEKFDMAYQCNNMKKFAESAPMIPSHMIVNNYIYVPTSPVKYFMDKYIKPRIYRLKKKIQFIKKRIKKFFYKKEKFSIGEDVINDLDFRIKNDSNENF